MNLNLVILYIILYPTIAVLSSMEAVITEIDNHTFPSLTNSSGGVLAELNCSLPEPSISVEKAKVRSMSVNIYSVCKLTDL